MKKITTLALGLLLPCLCMAQTVSIVGSRFVKPETNKGDTPITVHYEGSTASKDWVGIYKTNQVNITETDGVESVVLGGNNDKTSYRWFYTDAVASADVSNKWISNYVLGEGCYLVMFFPNDGYNITSHEYLIVTPYTDFTMSTDKKVYAVGDPVVVTWSGAPANAEDWIGIYHEGHTPGGKDPGGKEQVSTSYRYVNENGGATGSMTLNVLGTPNYNLHDNNPDEPGEYYVTYLLNNGYTELFEHKFARVPYTIATTYKETDTNNSFDTSLTTVGIRRTIKVGYNTVCLPFSLTAEQVAAAFGTGTKVYAFSENSDDANNATINFTETNTISANVPVLVKATKASDSQVFENVTVVDVTDAKVAGKNFDFVGTYAPMTVAEGDYFIGGGKLYKSKGATSMNAFRAYIQAKTDAPVKMFIGDFETSINELNANPDLSEATFNVAGQRIAGMQKGINIVNGKKVLK